MKIIKHDGASYLLCMSILLFSTVNALDNLFVISVLSVSSKDHNYDGSLPPRETTKFLAQSRSSGKKKCGSLLILLYSAVFLILNCSH